MTDRKPECEPNPTPVDSSGDIARRDNPLSSENDRWTGDPEADRALLVIRALAASPGRNPHQEDRDPVAEWHEQRLRRYDEARGQAEKEKRAATPQSENRLRKWGMRLVNYFRQGTE